MKMNSYSVTMVFYYHTLLNDSFKIPKGVTMVGNQENNRKKLSIVIVDMN